MLVIQKLGIKLEKDITSSLTNCTPKFNPQVLFKTFRGAIIDLSCKRTRKAIPKITITLHNLHPQFKSTLNSSTATQAPDILINAGLIWEWITQLEKTQYLSTCTTSLARYQLDGEKTDKYWSQID